MIDLAGPRTAKPYCKRRRLRRPLPPCGAAEEDFHDNRVMAAELGEHLLEALW